MEQKKKKNVLLLIAGIIGLLYTIFLISYFMSANAEATTDTDQIGAALATALVAPHMAIVIVGLVFNWIAFFISKPWAALVAGILYSVAIFFMPIYFWGTVVELILCFVAFAKLRKQNAAVPIEA